MRNEISTELRAEIDAVKASAKAIITQNNTIKSKFVHYFSQIPSGINSSTDIAAIKSDIDNYATVQSGQDQSTVGQRLFQHFTNIQSAVAKHAKYVEQHNTKNTYLTNYYRTNTQFHTEINQILSLNNYGSEIPWKRDVALRYVVYKDYTMMTNKAKRKTLQGWWEGNRRTTPTGKLTAHLNLTDFAVVTEQKLNCENLKDLLNQLIRAIECYHTNYLALQESWQTAYETCKSAYISSADIDKYLTDADKNQTWDVKVSILNQARYTNNNNAKSVYDAAKQTQADFNNNVIGFIADILNNLSTTDRSKINKLYTNIYNSYCGKDPDYGSQTTIPTKIAYSIVTAGYHTNITLSGFMTSLMNSMNEIFQLNLTKSNLQQTLTYALSSDVREDYGSTYANYLSTYIQQYDYVQSDYVAKYYPTFVYDETYLYVQNISGAPSPAMYTNQYNTTKVDYFLGQLSAANNAFVPYRSYIPNVMIPSGFISIAVPTAYTYQNVQKFTKRTVWNGSLDIDDALGNNREFFAQEFNKIDNITKYLGGIFDYYKHTVPQKRKDYLNTQVSAYYTQNVCPCRIKYNKEYYNSIGSSWIYGNDFGDMYQPWKDIVSAQYADYVKTIPYTIPASTITKYSYLVPESTVDNQWQRADWVEVLQQFIQDNAESYLSKFNLVQQILYS